MLIYNDTAQAYAWRNPANWLGDKYVAAKAGLKWSVSAQCWFTADPYKAFALRKHATPQLNGRGLHMLRVIADNVRSSVSQDVAPIPPPAPEGQKWYDFQSAGVWEMARRLNHPNRTSVLLADDPGLGKTCQSIGVANVLRARKLLVVCPASLRNNWLQEIERWHLYSPGVQEAYSNKHVVNHHGSLVTSFNLSHLAKDYQPDMVMVDEGHYIKNVETTRTQMVLGNMQKQWPGLVAKAPSIIMTGTPLPNGKPNEIWPYLYRCAPYAIGGLAYRPFINHFCTFWEDDGEPVITGARNERELYTRLRGSGLMIRRQKRKVLKDLPPKRYKMVVMQPTRETARVIKKEEPFSVEEINRYGVPEGSALAEVRHEMGIAKTPQCINYVLDMLRSGTHKVVVFVHHITVAELMHQAMARYGYESVMLYGKTPPKKRSPMVARFQDDPSVRVFISNEAGEEGITLTAARDVVLVEPEWVPGKNTQRADRLDRIGQLYGVILHYLLVEGSLDAKILGSATRKQTDIDYTLDVEKPLTN